MICFIPAAGFGTRMKDLTIKIPKPLLEVSGQHLLEINLKLGYMFGCREFVVNTHYLGEQIEKVISQYKNIKIHVSKETDKILGTAGGIKTGVGNKLRDDDYLLIINPDAIFYPDTNFNPLQENFTDEILLYLANSEEEGNVSLGLEKDKVVYTNGGLYYIGISLLRYGVLQNVPIQEYSDLSLLYRELSDKRKLSGKFFPGKVLDLGDKEKYLKYRETKLPEYANLIL